MRSLIKRIWGDTVGSQIISWAIVAGLTGLGLYFQSHLAVWGYLWEAARQAVVSTASWLWAPVALPRAVVLFVFGLLLARSAVFLRERVSAAARLQGRLQEAPAPPPPPAEPAPPPGAAAPELTDRQRTLLLSLLRVYPGSIDLRVVVQHFELTYPAAERLVERLEELGLVTIRSATPYSPKAVRLNKQGRDFCFDNGIAVDK